MKTTTTTTSTTTTRMVVLFVVMLFSSFGFAQNVSVEPTVAVEINTTTTTATEANANMNMVSWFMGSKQTTRETLSNESNAKKQMMTSGIAPNRLLIKTLLKKASNYATNVA